MHGHFNRKDFLEWTYVNMPSSVAANISSTSLYNLGSENIILASRIRESSRWAII